MSEEVDYRKLILELIAALCQCEDMGDVSSEVAEVLERMGVNIEWADFDELLGHLNGMGIYGLWEEGGSGTHIK